MTEYNQSIYYDRAFYKQDIAGSIAWAKANHKAGILSNAELQEIVDGLKKVEKEWAEGNFEIRPGIDEVGLPHFKHMTALPISEYRIFTLPTREDYQSW